MTFSEKPTFTKDIQYVKFCLYGFLKNQRFFEPFLILIFLNSKGLNFTQIGTLYSIRFILRAIFEIPSGIVADTLGRRTIMIFSYAAYMLSFLGYYFASNFYILIIPAFLFALGDAFRTGTHKAMIFEYLKRNGWENQKTHYYGRTRAWSQAGSAISSLLAAAFVLLGGNYNNIFLYSLIPYTVGALLLASYPAFLDGNCTHNRNHNLLNRFKKTFVNTYRSFTHKRTLALSINISAYSGFYMSAKDYLQVILSSSVLSIPFIYKLQSNNNEGEVILIGMVYFILYFISAGASRMSGKVGTLFKNEANHLNSLLVTGMVICIATGLLLHNTLYILSAISFIVILVIENLRRPAGVALLAGRVNSDILASALSIESQLNSVIAAALSFIIGIFADILSPGIALSLASITVLLIYPLIRIRNN